MKSQIIAHRFRESGLPYVILRGVKQFRCEECGKTLIVCGDINQLNRLIAETLLKKKNMLTGAEIRFLRTHVGYSSEIFARLIGLDKTSLSRIENDRATVSNQVSMSVRWAVACKLADCDYHLHNLVTTIENDELIQFKAAQFKASSKGRWTLDLNP